MTAILYEVKIAGTDVMDYMVKGNVTRTFGKTMSDATISVSRDVTDAVTPSVGSAITIKRGESPDNDTYFLFEGYIVDVKKDFGQYKLKCFDKIFDLRNKQVHYTYDQAIDTSAGVITDIIDDMIETFGDLTCTINQTSGTVHIIERYVCEHTDIFERILELLDVIDYQMYWDATNQVVILEPKGFTDATDGDGNPLVLRVDVTGETTNIMEPPKWQYNLKRMFNNLTVRGATSETETTETFNGDAAEKEFSLASVPTSVKVYVDSVLKTGGVLDATETYDYHVDRHKDAPKIIFLVAPGAGASNVEVRYSYMAPIPVVVKDTPSIDAYYEVEKTVHMPDIETVNDAEERGNALLAKYSSPFITGKCKTLNTIVDIDPGELVRIDDDINSEDRQVVILNIKHTIPYAPDELTLGDEEYRTEDWGEDVEKKLKKLQEQLAGKDDVVTFVIATNLNIYENPYESKIISQKVNDSFILAGSNRGGIDIPNSLLEMGTILDSMEAVGNWADGGGAVTFTLAADSDHEVEGTNALKLTWSAETPSTTGQIVDSTTSLGDISAHTGQSSGTPTQGTVGMWIYLADSGDIEGDITLRLGSDSSNYTEMTGREYTSGDYQLETATWVTGLNYVLFDLDGGSETGTPDWTAPDYSRIEFTVGVAAESLWIDYYTVSSSNYIGLNGLGQRFGAEVTEATHTW